MSDTIDRDWVKEVGEPAYATIVEMVAALECDYDRLEELADKCNEWIAENPPYEDGDGLPVVPMWIITFPDDATELKELTEAAGECKDEDDATQRILEDALSVEVRSGWATSAAEFTAAEFSILVCTGGPAVRILGELDDGTPHRAWLEVQDWGKPWTQYFPADQDTLLAYARCFCFE